ncbi:glycosyltransferase, activator-dependent family [Thermomonospora echinospora]|uniref:Glycosyltransferase, activator-dependent family n=1 Tax=Thermomonospora echinospora TaxID=1992 RepID=A0A1H5TR99_9ACTN|nr:activator-dependent family glycosyltransferase [Thermomonospora echinospora]SEF65313.1 glycosyltransferase, activator-dependent family [Thermomonospora echinospora]
MRVLFVTLPTKAHAFAQVPLAWALRAAGHEVCVASQPELVDDITRTGLTAVPIGPELDQAGMVEENRRQREAAEQADLDVPDPELLLKLDGLPPEAVTYDYMQGLFTVMTTLAFKALSPQHAMDELVRFAREWRPDLVVWDTLVLAAPVAAKACGAAHARLLYSLDLLGRMRERYQSELARRPVEVWDDPVREWLESTLDRYGCGYSEDLMLGQWTIDPVPSSMRLPVDLPYVPVRFVPYNGRAELPGWLRRSPERRRICLTLGLSFREMLGGDRVSVAELLDAVADLDVEVVATLNAEQLAGVDKVPDNVRAVDFVPLNELLPGCLAIVHQGGFGQVQTAMAHGVPQVVLPNGTWDTVPRAWQVQDFGAGLVVDDPDRVSAAEIREKVVRVLQEPGFAVSAARLREEMLATPAPAEIVPLLERLTAEHRAR